MLRSIALAALAGAGPVIAATIAHAGDRTVFVGGVIERTDATLTLRIGSDEIIIIDTSRLNPGMADGLTANGLTVKSAIVDGRHVAGRHRLGDEPNEIHNPTNEMTLD